MKLWILRPISGDSLWNPWYDKSFGFIIQADAEEDARRIAQRKGGDESRDWSADGNRDDPPAWTSSEHSTCKELKADGTGEGVVMRDFASA